MKKYNGSITIYFVFAIILIISVIFSITEMARMNCQKLYMQIATDASLDSMASLYYRKLNEYYNLYGVEYREKEMLKDEYLSYLSPFMKDASYENYINNWYIGKIEKENIDLSYKLLTDNKYFEKEILHYMKYDMAEKTIDFLGKKLHIGKDDAEKNILVESANDVFEEVGKSELYSEVYERYFDFHDDIKKLESYAKNVNNYIKDTNRDIESLRTATVSGSVSNGEKIVEKINSVETSINSLKKNLDNFKSKLADLRNAIDEKRALYENDRLKNKYEFDDEIVAFIEDEFKRFYRYVDTNSPMAIEVENKKRECDTVKSSIENFAENIKSQVSELKSIEDDLAYEKSLKGDERDSDTIKSLNEDKKDAMESLKEEIKNMKEEVRELKITDTNLMYSTSEHSSKENTLKKLVSLKDNLTLSLVLDSEDLNKISNDTISYGNFDILSDTPKISLDKILLTEYELSNFNYYNKDKNEEVTKSGSKTLEVERLISGKVSDTENLKSTITKIFLYRLAMNILHIYKSSEKREVARNFTMTIFAGISPLLSEVMFVILISAWGAAQSIVDIKKLLKNKKVKFMHDNASWDVGIGKVLDILTNNVECDDRDDDGIAFSYKDYLRLLLWTANQREVNTRMVQLIDNNIKKESEDFDFNKLIYEFIVENTFLSKHFFTNFSFVDANNVTLNDEYKIKISAVRSFYEP